MERRRIGEAGRMPVRYALLLSEREPPGARLICVWSIDASTTNTAPSIVTWRTHPEQKASRPVADVPRSDMEKRSGSPTSNGSTVVNMIRVGPMRRVSPRPRFVSMGMRMAYVIIAPPSIAGRHAADQFPEEGFLYSFRHRSRVAGR
jgi:hypothetical protein